MILANCRILKPIGVGSSGTVYRGFHIVLNRAVAIKILTLTEANKEVQAERFLSEARSISSIKHEHIVSIYDAGWSEGHCYIVMELSRGKSLAELISSQKDMAPSTFLNIARQCCLGLSAAHEAGIIHRDVKAQNILLASNGRVKVCDFGLAQRIHGHPEFSRYRLISGTPTYMSPEQIRASKVDPRSDLYSLGVTFFEMLTGHPPFSQNTVREVMAAHLNKTPPSLALKRPDIHPAIAELVDQCLEKDPNLRPQSAKDILARLDSIQSRTKRTTRPQTRSRDRSPILFGALIFTCLSLFSVSAHQQRSRALKDHQNATTQLKLAQDDAARARRALSLLQRARDAARRGRDLIPVEELTEAALELNHHSYDSLLSAAHIYERAGALDHARLKLRQALEKQDPAYEALFYLHKLNSQRQTLEDSSHYLEELLREAEQRKESNEFTLFAQAHIELNAGRPSKALEKYQELQKLSPRLPELYLNRGLSYVQLQQSKKALKDFNEALRLRPAFPEAYNNRGLLQLKLGRLALALHDFQRALEINPQFFQALNNRGSAREASGQLGLAEQDYSHALLIEPAFPEAYLNRARCRLSLRRFKEALSDCRKAQELGLNNQSLRLTQGLTLFQLQKYNRALASFEWAHNVSQCQEEKSLLKIEQGRCFEALKQTKRAIDCYESALKQSQKASTSHRAKELLSALQEN